MLLEAFRPAIKGYHCVLFSMSLQQCFSALVAAQIWRMSMVLLCIYLCVSLAIGTTPSRDTTAKPGWNENQDILSKFSPPSDYASDTVDFDSKAHLPDVYEDHDALSTLISALDVMQDRYFEVWQGNWPTAIDWTSAVLGTYLSAALSTLSTSYDYIVTRGSAISLKDKINENLINRYFSQLVASYFGQDILRLRNEGYDDMLWVVLGWLESIKFINLHSEIHYKEPQSPSPGTASKQTPWFGEQWIPAFAHRARVFWDLAAAGWDTTLCGGGMLWSPYTSPYKNAVTNELFIAASIAMYLYFPGDDNTSPFIKASGLPVGPRDPKYLTAALKAYRWLYDSNMTNPKGLYTDGFHITNWSGHPKNNTINSTKCDLRNEMIYTYNQGVILSGQRGLWIVTGARSFLEDGHKLISNVINATGYNLKRDKIYDEVKGCGKSKTCLGKWHGLGRSGILEDLCDAYGHCSQDGQAFKGIFFHHLATFCAPLPTSYAKPRETSGAWSDQNDILWHKQNCARYSKWIRRNAEAAISTRDEYGNYGMWWGAPALNLSDILEREPPLPDGAVDYRNHGFPRDEPWQQPSTYHPSINEENMLMRSHMHGARRKDANDRGRGRTVETQGGGVMVLRALWEIVGIENDILT